MRRLLKSLFKKKSKEDIFESELCYSCNSSLPIKSKFNIYKCKSCNTLNFKAFSIANIQLEEFISYGGSGAVFKSGDKAIVSSDIHVAGGSPVNLQYRLYQPKPGQWLVYDATIAGLGLIRTYRAQFNDQIQRDGIDKTIAQLQSVQL